MATNTGMTKSQKEAVFLLSVGTFLEYFDVLLYVHMAVLLNELFFPQTDPLSTQLFAAGAFCATYLLRPIGGFIIGRIGDSIGRKPTVLITTFVMAAACLTMASLPTYAEVGITASVIVIICRMLQGFSSMGEITGAVLYLSEILKPPSRCVASAVLVSAEALGGFFALSVASFVLSMGVNWRYAFGFGAFIAVIGLIARTRLRETPEFVDYKRRIKDKIKKSNQVSKTLENINVINEKVDKKAILAFAFTEFHYPISFYIAYIYLADFMKTSLKMSPEQVINQNLKVSIFVVIGTLTIAYLVRKIHPVKIAIVMATFFVILLPIIPYWLNNTSGLFSLFCIQCLLMSFVLSTMGTLDAIIYKYFPISKRFTFVATSFGIANPLAKVMVAFSLIPLSKYLGHYALWVMFIPAVIGYCWGISYFRKLEIERGLYHNYPCEEPGSEDTALMEEDFEYDDLPDEYKPFKGNCEYSIQLFDKLEKLSKEKGKKLNIKLIEKAVTFAKYWHYGQMRKVGNIPYYSHPFAVAEEVAERYLKTDVIIAAMLHDVIEDSDCTAEIIEKAFNARIAEMVDRLTNVRYESGQKIKLTFEQGIEKLQKVGDYEALFIKNCDRTHNLQTIEGLKPEKQQKMAKETTAHLVGMVAYIAEKLGIHDKVYLENKIFKLAQNVLRKNKI